MRHGYGKILKKQFLFLFFFGFIFAIDASDACACSVCVIAAFDCYLPPVGIWCLFSIGWFFIASAIVTTHKVTIIGIPKLSAAIVGTVIGVVASFFIGIGIGFVLLLLLLCLISSVSIFNNSNKLNHRFVKQFKIVSSIGICCFISLIILSVSIKNSRNDIDFILKWPNTYVGKTKFNDLYHKGSEGLKDIKAGFEKGDPRAVANLCNSLSMHYNFENELQLRNLCNSYMGNFLD